MKKTSMPRAMFAGVAGAASAVGLFATVASGAGVDDSEATAAFNPTTCASGSVTFDLTGGGGVPLGEVRNRLKSLGESELFQFDGKVRVVPAARESGVPSGSADGELRFAVYEPRSKQVSGEILLERTPDSLWLVDSIRVCR